MTTLPLISLLAIVLLFIAKGMLPKHSIIKSLGNYDSYLMLTKEKFENDYCTQIDLKVNIKGYILRLRSHNWSYPMSLDDMLGSG